MQEYMILKQLQDHNVIFGKGNCQHEFVQWRKIKNGEHACEQCQQKNLRKPCVRAAVHVNKSMPVMNIGNTGKGD